MDGEINEQTKEEAEKCKIKGNELFSAGRFVEAIERYTTAMAINPNNPVYPANRAMAQINLSRYAAAERDCSLALEMNPTFIKALLRRATARKHLGHWREAICDCQEVLSIQPTNKQASEELEYLIKNAPNNMKNKLNIKQTTNVGRFTMSNSKTETLNNPETSYSISQKYKAPNYPKTSAEFELTLMRNQNWDSNVLKNYIHNIKTDDLSQLIGPNIVSILPILITYMKLIINDDSSFCLKVFQELIKCTRFKSALAFLDKKKKTEISELFNKISCSTDQMASSIDSLKSLYEI